MFEILCETKRDSTNTIQFLYFKEEESPNNIRREADGGY